MAKIIDLEQARRTEETMRFLIPKAVAGDDRKAMNAICDIPKALVDQMHLVYDARMRVIGTRLRTRENRITL